LLIAAIGADVNVTLLRARARAAETADQRIGPLAIQYREVQDLIPYARNARTHSEAQVAEIAGSIREFGFTNPVLIDPEGGIIAGHGPGCGAGFGSRTGCATFPRHGPAAGGEALA
jgi:hypothetical protein